MRQDGLVEVQYYVQPDDKQKIDQAAKGNISDFTRRAIAFYMEHGLETSPITTKSKRGGKREGAGRKKAV